MTEHMEDALVSKLERIRVDMQRQINADLFADGVGWRAHPVIKGRHWSRRLAARASAYLSTLWKAIRGVELEEPSEWD